MSQIKVCPYCDKPRVGRRCGCRISTTVPVKAEDVQFMEPGPFFPIKIFDRKTDAPIHVFDPYKGTIKTFKEGKRWAVMFFPEEDRKMLDEILPDLRPGRLVTYYLKTEYHRYLAYCWRDDEHH